MSTSNMYASEQEQQSFNKIGWFGSPIKTNDFNKVDETVTASKVEPQSQNESQKPPQPSNCCQPPENRCSGGPIDQNVFKLGCQGWSSSPSWGPPMNLACCCNRQLWFPPWGCCPFNYSSFGFYQPPTCLYSPFMLPHGFPNLCCSVNLPRNFCYSPPPYPLYPHFPHPQFGFPNWKCCHTNKNQENVGTEKTVKEKEEEKKNDEEADKEDKEEGDEEEEQEEEEE